MKTAAPSPAICSAFSPGAWFLLQYGFDFQMFYITEVVGDRARISKPGWCVSAGVWLTRKQMEGPYHKAQYAGHGKPKWYWRFLPWRDVVTPFHKPTGQQTAPACQ